MQTDPKRGLGRSPNGGLGGQSPPTAKPSNNFFRFPVHLLITVTNQLSLLMCTFASQLLSWATRRAKRVAWSLAKQDFSEAEYKCRHRRTNETLRCLCVCYHESLWRCLRELRIVESSGLRHFVGNCVLQKSYISDFEKFKARSH